MLLFSNTQVTWGHEGHWNPRSHPVYLTPTRRVTLSPHGAVPLIEEQNPHYGYWATVRFLDEEDTRLYLGPNYVGNVNPRLLTQRR